MSAEAHIIKSDSNKASSNRAGRKCNSIYEAVKEVDIAVTDIDGEIPEGMVGTLFRNGPGQRRFSTSFFDGDGMIRALKIGADKKVSFKSKFVHTPKYTKELNSQKPLYRTAGCNMPGGVFKNAFRIPADEANTHVFQHKGKIIASEEGGHPWIMDPITLETEGEEHFNGQLPKQVAFSAHPHYDADRKEIYNFGMSPGKTMSFQCFKLDQNNKLTMLAKFPCHKGTFAHDYALSGKWMVFILPPSSANLPKFLFGMSSFFDTMKWRPEWGAQIVLVPKDGGRATIIDTDSFSVGHYIGAWDEGDDIIVDVATTPDMAALDDVSNFRNSDWQSFGDTVISRIRINSKTKNVVKETICDIPAEFPRIHPKMECQKSLWTYMASNTYAGEGGLFKATMKLNRETGATDIYDFGDDCVSLEPVFIPHPDGKSEDEGWVVDYVYSQITQKTDVVIFNAKCLSDGPICTIHLPLNAGTTFHGTWVSA